MPRDAHDYDDDAPDREDDATARDIHPGRTRRRRFVIPALLLLTALAAVLAWTGNVSARRLPAHRAAIPVPPPRTVVAAATAPATPAASAIAVPPAATAYPTPFAGQTVPGPSYLVGAYYFSGWSHHPNDNLTPLLTRSPLRRFEPLIGWYDDSQAQVDRTIDQAAGAGVGFFAFDWYDLARSPYATDQALNEGLHYYLLSRHRRQLGFCINFVDLAPLLPRARDWPGLVRIWIRYFQQPGYIHVYGKPLFIVFSPEHMREIFGGSTGVRAALDYMRAVARAYGLPGVTIAVGTTVTPHANRYHTLQLLGEGYDVTTGYNYHSVDGEHYRTPVPYAHLVRENTAMWERVAAALPYPYIPVLTMGWDQRFSIREQKTAIIYAGRTPDQFLCYASAARRWIDVHAARTVPERIIMLFAWNEIGEGSALIPNRSDGYAYGNVIRRVFGAPRQAPGPYAC